MLLDQSVVSGIGNIYADEALWRARIHYDTPAHTLAPARVRTLLEQARAVMREALAQGGTSFDSLYVNVNGSSGYFSRSLAVYGRAGPTLSAVRATHRPRAVHESVRLPLPGLPAAPAGGDTGRVSEL